MAALSEYLDLKKDTRNNKSVLIYCIIIVTASFEPGLLSFQLISRYPTLEV